MISDHAAEIFLEARTLDPETRAQFLMEACGDHEELLGAVNSLLAASNESEAYFEQLADKVGLGALAEDDKPLPEDKVIGPWRLLKRIGRGGMGSVYLAERADEQFEQQAALKILPTGLDTEHARARFLVERQILARLVHDNIARLLDGGVTDEGVPYFVMDYVEGKPIDEYCDEHKLGTAARLSLIMDVAEAVQFAHRNLIIHRDLKPNNVLVTDAGQARLLDFGIAKMLEPDADTVRLTRVTQRPVTPTFASWEMLAGEPVDVTTDVYSLGVLMYVLLTGHAPLRYEGMNLTEMCEYAATETPPPVSHFDRTLQGDLDVIIAKALAKESGERYGSAESLANDIRNYLAGLPVAAKAPSALYRGRKFLRRHRVGTAFAVFAIVALATIAGLAVRSAIISDQQTQKIALERDRAEETKEFLISIFDSADPNVMPGSQTAREILDAGRERIERELAEQPSVQADLLETMGHVYISWRLPDEGREVLERVRQLRAATSGENTTEYADVLIGLAVITDIGGDYESSLAYGKQALTIGESLQDPKGQAAGHERIGRISHLQGDLDSAGTHFRRALELYRNELGEESEDVAFLREHLANLLNHQQQYEASLAEFEKVLAIKRKLISGDNSEISPIYLGMGSTLTKLGRHEEAVQAYETAYAMNVRLYGPDNSYNLYVAAGLGKVAEARGDLETAASRYNEALRLINRHTPDSPNLGFANANIGKVYALQGRYDLALPYYRTAVELLAERLPAHWKLGDVQWRMGQCLVESGNYIEAEPLILTGMDIVAKQWGPDHEFTGNARAAAVSLYEAWGKPDNAQAFR